MIGQEPPYIIVDPPGPHSRATASRLAAVECPAFNARRSRRERESQAEQSPIVYSHGSTCNVFDVDGNRYVDLVAGFGALPLGHAPSILLDRLIKQGGELWLALGDVYGSVPKLSLCERLAGLYPEPGARVLLGLSGGDAVTAAMKTAVLATGKQKIVAFKGSYHGLSYGPLAACGLDEGYRVPFAGQLGDHVTFALYPRHLEELAQSLLEVEKNLAKGDVGAVLVEPVLGRGGCVVPPPGFLQGLRTLCDTHGALLISDEIWTGLGRSGAWLASVAMGILPDVVCVGKGLGGGLPISACIGSERVMAAWGDHRGSAIHTATHFGSPLACACAVATLDVLEQIIPRVADVGVQLRTALRDRVLDRGVIAVDGMGLMVGIRVAGGSARALAVSRALLQRGYIVLTGGTGGDVITLTPPLVIDPSLLVGFADALSHALEENEGGIDPGMTGEVPRVLQ